MTYYIETNDGNTFTGIILAKDSVKILFTADKYGEMDILISENYFIQTASETAIILSFGGRSIIKKAGLDYGLIIPIIGGMDQFLALPWLGITIPFGNK